MKWHSKDYHNPPMWCGRRICLIRDEFSTMAKCKREPSKDPEEGKERKFVNKDLKTALVTMTSPADYKIPEEQFLEKNRWREKILLG